MRVLLHLAARFFRSIVARRPGPPAQRFIADHLDETLAELFWRQPVPDLDHALRGARWLASETPRRPDLVKAFLLHDIGKRHSRLGTWGRSVVTALSLVRLPVGSRGRVYLDHGTIGAEELGNAGADLLTVSFARYHGSTPPSDLADADWQLLSDADRR